MKGQDVSREDCCMSLKHEKIAYTIEEVAELLSLSRAQIYRLIDLREIATIHIGRAHRITAKQLDDYISRTEARFGFRGSTGQFHSKKYP